MRQNKEMARNEEKVAFEERNKLDLEVLQEQEQNLLEVYETLQGWNYSPEEIIIALDYLKELCVRFGRNYYSIISRITAIEVEELAIRANHIVGYGDIPASRIAIQRLTRRGIFIASPVEMNNLVDMQTGEIITAPLAYLIHWMIMIENPEEDLIIMPDRKWSEDGMLLYGFEDRVYAIENDPNNAR